MGWHGRDTPGAASSGAAHRMRQEHEEEERRRFDEFEHRAKLGSHWVKPPPRGTKQQWDGWVQGGAGKKVGGTDSDDDDSSSVLSFDIGIDLQSLDLHDLEPMNAEDNMGEVMGQAEVWRMKPAEPAS